MKIVQFKYIVLMGLIFSLASVEISAQVGIGTTTPNANAMLDIDVSSLSPKKGILSPRMTTTERTALGAVMGASEESMLVYDTDLDHYYFWDGVEWFLITDHRNHSGTLYFTGNSTKTNITSNSTVYKVVGSTTYTHSQADVNGTGDQLQYTGNEDRIFTVTCSFTAWAQDKDRLFTFYIYKSGAVEPSIKLNILSHHMKGSSQPKTFTMTGTVLLSQNDYIDLRVQNTSDTNDITIVNMNLSISH